MPRSGYEIGEIVAALAARAGDLARDLAPEGKDVAGEWVALNPARVDGRPGSFKVCLRGAKAGVWKDFATGDAGDALDLVAYLAAGGDKAAAVKWALQWLGWQAGEPAAVKRARAEACAAAAARQKAEAERSAARRQAAAWRIWRESRAIAPQDVVWRYLGGRGIDLGRFARLPRSLRMHPSLLLPGADWRDPAAPRAPALVAAVTSAPTVDHPGGRLVAVHRTYLAELPGGSVGKRDFGDGAKATLGGLKGHGAAIRLWRGASGRPLHQLPPGAEVIAGEGIENVLTAVLARPAPAAIAAVSLANLAEAWLPPAAATVWWIHDGDAPGSPAALQAEAVLARWLAEGRVVREVRASGAKDLNALVSEGRAA